MVPSESPAAIDEISDAASSDAAGSEQAGMLLDRRGAEAEAGAWALTSLALLVRKGAVCTVLAVLRMRPMSCSALGMLT